MLLSMKLTAELAAWFKWTMFLNFFLAIYRIYFFFIILFIITTRDWEEIVLVLWLVVKCNELI